MQTAAIATEDLSVRHVPVFCPDEWRYDRAIAGVMINDNFSLP